MNIKHHHRSALFSMNARIDRLTDGVVDLSNAVCWAPISSLYLGPARFRSYERSSCDPTKKPSVAVNLIPQLLGQTIAAIWGHSREVMRFWPAGA